MIDHYEFGRFIVNGKEYKSNITIVEGEVKEHRYLPGHDLLLEDIKPLVDAKPEYLIIGTGAYGVIKVKKEIIDYVKAKGIELIIMPTKEACAEFNRLIKQNRKVAAFLHNTC